MARFASADPVRTGEILALAEHAKNHFLKGEASIYAASIRLPEKAHLFESQATLYLEGDFHDMLFFIAIIKGLLVN